MTENVSLFINRHPKVATAYFRHNEIIMKWSCKSNIIILDDFISRFTRNKLVRDNIFRDQVLSRPVLLLQPYYKDLFEKYSQSQNVINTAKISCTRIKVLYVVETYSVNSLLYASTTFCYSTVLHQIAKV